MTVGLCKTLTPDCSQTSMWDEEKKVKVYDVPDTARILLKQ